ncbi:hypothetical protein PASE110613_17690 [Paenibacillus sediminis]|uniref:DUF4375 domain-containing protein n=1 Tax=Paenibacillus sediminis TaxID=664909 RepID=A0ABS4H2I1_9BACL|nr:hypothetical protein [Paenibacillus sediminis]MBP1936582.1 hypothetical protein [Paenibacillus sediminis]
MLIRIKQDELLKDSLSWLCIEPMLISVRGKNLDEKVAVYNQLNEGQQALYLFYAFYNHVHTIEEFYWFTSYFIGELKAWNGLKSGVLFYRDQELINILEQMELVIKRKNMKSGEWKQASPTDLENDIELNEYIKPIFIAYQNVVGRFIQRMNSYIRSHKEEFLEIDE